MKKKIFFVLIFLLIILINTIAYGKYVIEYTSTVAKINIDRIIPKITMIDIKNTNTGYEKYANHTHVITAKIKVTEKNIKENNFNDSNLEILIGGKVQTTKNIGITQIEAGNDYIIYEVVLENLLSDGILEIKINEGTIVDKSENKNEETIISTGIQIDNTLPITTFSQELLSDGKVTAKIKANECIRNIEGWAISTDKQLLSKQFPYNVSYLFEVTDFAQNVSEVEINITQATNIQISYGTFSYGVNGSGAKWYFGEGNNGIAGKEMIETNSIRKTEIMAFNITGDIDNDFIQIRNYLHTYWGEGSKSTSFTYEYRYYHGYNPSSDSYSSMSNGRKANLNGIYHLLLGGDGVNNIYAIDIVSRKKIPSYIAEQYLYGVSAFTMNLKDYSEYSIVYQIFINGYGWVAPASDGEETRLALDKPMSAYRLVLVPKTEKKYILKMWEKDVGTYNVN